MWNTRGPIRISDKNLNRWSEQSFFDQTLMNFIQAPSAWKAVIENSERMVYSIRELFDCSFHRFSTFQTSQSSLSWYLKPWCILSSNKWNYLMPRQSKNVAAGKFNMGFLALLKGTLRHQLDLIEQTVPVVEIMVREALQRRGSGEL